MTARHDACPKRPDCTPHACEAGGGKWSRCPVVGAWQPIETAPKDRRIILWTGREIYIGHWAKNVETDHEAWIIAEWGDGDQAMTGAATHWMEAPKAPK